MKRIFFWVYITLTLCGTANVTFGQDKNTENMEPLTVGDVLPQLPIMELMHYDAENFDMSTLQERLVIFDFFHTSCVNCIFSFPKLDSLKRHFGNKLDIIIVTSESKDKMERFYQNNAFLKNKQLKMPTIYADTILSKYFPHQAVPHSAWIYGGEVKAVTYADFIDGPTIQRVLDGEKIDVPVKNDFLTGISTAVPEVDALSLGSVKLSGFRHDKPMFDGIHTEHDANGIFQSYFYNVETLGIFKALSAKIETPTFLLTPERIVWNVDSIGRYRYEEGGNGQNRWLYENAISYHRMDGNDIPEAERVKVIWQDIENFLGIDVYWGTREMDCLVIREVTPQESRDSTKGQTVEGTGVLAFLLDYSGRYPPVVDEVKNKVKMVIGSYNDLEELNSAIRTYGIEVVPARRTIRVLHVDERTRTKRGDG